MKKTFFWIIQLTWGLPTNLLGGFVYLFMVLTGHKAKIFHQMLFFEGGKQGSGFNLGFVAVVNPTDEDLLRHEHGHFIQNFYFGFLQPFILLASVTRFWYRDFIYKTNKEKFYDLPPYDAIWFEGQATRLGNKYLK